ncbi:MAG: hypothetical protein EXS30_00255 [Pedosphaera sp.]|nr:hypothetical protein [Pedosphaera sp.]
MKISTLGSLFLLLAFLTSTGSLNADVVISEFLASNTKTLADRDGDYSDWIELHNTDVAPVNVGGWYLTDSANDLQKWRLPSVTIGPSGYVIVYASGKDRAVAGGELHTNFSLSSGGEYLGLIKPDGKTVVYEFNAEYPEQHNDVSYGSVGNSQHYFSSPTPGSPNGVGFIAYAGSPKFSHDRGFYDAPFILNITSETPGAMIRYSTNGIEPSATNGVVYTGPITIDRTTVLRALVSKENYQSSKVATQTYLFLEDVIRQSPDGKPQAGWPTKWGSNVVNYGMDPDVVENPLYRDTIKNDLKTIPSFCVVMDLTDLFNSSTGNYANPGQDGAAWERPCSLELVYPDGRKGFQINAGTRIRGGFSRSRDNPKHALRFFFREEYGDAKLKHPLFGKNGTDAFDAIDLRTFQNYSWSFQGDPQGVFIRDQFSRDTQLAMGQQGERGDYYHLYINGVYWGLYNTCERPEASYGATYFGGNKEDFDVIKVEAGPYSINATDGNMSAWTQLYTLSKPGLTNNDAYFRIQGRNADGTLNPAYTNLVDVVNLIDYMLVIVYGGNLDAPISNFLGNSSPNNWYGMRNRVGTDGFRFFAHDAEHTLLEVNQNRMGPFSSGDSSVLKSNPQWIWQKMWANQEFRILAADRIHKHFFNAGALTPQSARERFLKRKNEIDRAVVGESARWGDSKRATPLTRVDWLKSVNNILTNYLPKRSDIVLNQLKSKGLYPSVVAPAFNQHGGGIAPGFSLTISAPIGVIYFTRDGSDPRLLGGAIAPSATVSTQPLILNESTFVKARVLADNVWSALLEGEFTITRKLQDLLLTEIMYNPPLENGQDGDHFEFIELKNVGKLPLDLSGVHFTEGVGFTFPPGTQLAPGEFAVLVSNPAVFVTKHPGVRIAGAYQGHLSNGGEKLTLAQTSGEIVFSVDFKDNAPWPVAADGTGLSLVPVNPNVSLDPNDAANWRASSKPGGSPGADDVPALTGLAVINEISTHSDPIEVDRIELHNPTAAPVNVGGWFLTDDRNHPKKFRIPAGTVIPPDGYKVYSEADFNPQPGIDSSFSLSSFGEEVYLFSADATGNLTGFSDGFNFGGSENGVSFGRHTNTVGEIQYPAQIIKTLGSVNSGPRVGPVVINEIQYHPSSSGEEFIELKNISGETVKFYNPQHPTDTWRLDGVGFEFPQNFALTPNGFVLFVATDPRAFRSHYGVSNTVPIFGPYTGSLQDNGEWLRLLRPDNPDILSDGTAMVPFITVDEVRYNNALPWPLDAGGFGASIERINSQAYGNDPANWRASFGPPSPGLENIDNRAPRVNAGADQALQATTFPTTATLNATVIDDGLPNPPGTIASKWTQVSGPGPVLFANAAQTATTASFPGGGVYTLRFAADDGQFQAGDEVTVTVERASSKAAFIATGSVWKYSDKGTDLSDTWRESKFDDSAWASGKAQLGYGDGDEATTVSFGPNANNKYTTTYFRRVFSVVNATSVASMNLRILRDDGAVVYLNGKEIFRSNMPEGDIAFATFASAVVSNDDETVNFFESGVDVGALVSGVNVLAVEVHQVNLTSTDISFDLDLTALLQPSNQTPVVSAGTVGAGSANSPIALNGSATDDGLPIPPGQLTTTWSKVGGPGTVVFVNANAAKTTAVFSDAGTYVLRLTSGDGMLSARHEVTITVTSDAFAAWKALYFTAAELADPNFSSSDADPDRDGHSNAQEFIAGTHPQESSSVLRATSVERTVAGVKIRFGAVTGKTYTVQAYETVGSGAWIKVRDLAASNITGPAEVIDSSDAAGAIRFYRIVTPQQP